MQRLPSGLLLRGARRAFPAPEGFRFREAEAEGTDSGGRCQAFFPAPVSNPAGARRQAASAPQIVWPTPRPTAIRRIDRALQRARRQHLTVDAEGFIGGPAARVKGNCALCSRPRPPPGTWPPPSALAVRGDACSARSARARPPARLGGGGTRQHHREGVHGGRWHADRRAAPGPSRAHTRNGRRLSSAAKLEA
jgi:hypothetical protein